MSRLMILWHWLGFVCSLGGSDIKTRRAMDLTFPGRSTPLKPGAKLKRDITKVTQIAHMLLFNS